MHCLYDHYTIAHLTLLFVNRNLMPKVAILYESTKDSLLNYVNAAIISSESQYFHLRHTPFILAKMLKRKSLPPFLYRTERWEAFGCRLFIERFLTASYL